MKKIIALGLTAAGVIWALGKVKQTGGESTPVDTWAAGTDSI